MGRGGVMAWVAALAVEGMGCSYQAHATPDGGVDGSSDAQVEDVGQGEGEWVLQHGGVTIPVPPDCGFVEGQTVALRVDVSGEDGCSEPGPAHAQRGAAEREIVLTGVYWAPRKTETTACNMRGAHAPRWVELGRLTQGTWNLEGVYPDSIRSIEVGPPPAADCSGPPGALGDACEVDCQCGEGTCFPSRVDGVCGGRCAGPCRGELDCGEGLCASELGGIRECAPRDETCVDDNGCPPGQRCQDAACTWRITSDPEVACQLGTDCPAGWSCVADAEHEPSKCAVRCLTERTPCPFGACSADSPSGVPWTCDLQEE